ncbi:KCNJ5-like protein [Mya arenaria]|uniref:KCNJ5-like protein n=1 Tax=Mya arenaria TaxID=6604 RepID=A0ABY7E2H0_MYAAR|nr:G protein-activated inward rectifier potassium channel 4-like [Mya arenaria]WAR03126.1 KCNJ5-like protein [Mya arenaria]
MKTQDSFQMVEFPEVEDGKVLRGYQMGRPALVRKGGQYRISYRGMGQKGKRFFGDLYQSLIDMKWRYVIIIFCGLFLFVYLMFAILWWLMAYTHGDFEHFGDPNWVPCINLMRNFADALLFSIETQTTIGYGTIWPDANCMGTLPLVYLQVTVGFILETILLGFMLVKVARPKNRRKTLVYSSVATVVKEEGELVLQVRLGDLRKSHLVDTKAYGIFIKDKVTDEGVHFPLYQHHMEFTANKMDDRVFLIWPLVLNHKINEDSPLYDMKPEDILHSNNFEIVVILEGTIESTGEICQARTSYTSKDILWGYRFENIVEFDHEHGKWRANFKLFDDVIASATPKCSGSQLDYLTKGGRTTFERQNSVGKPTLRKAYSHKESLNTNLVEDKEEASSLVKSLKESLKEDRF